jgi:hypothetical protein
MHRFLCLGSPPRLLFGGGFGLGLQLGLGGANLGLPLLLVDHPVRHLVAALAAAYPSRSKRPSLGLYVADLLVCLLAWPSIDAGKEAAISFAKAFCDRPERSQHQTI